MTSPSPSRLSDAPRPRWRWRRRPTPAATPTATTPTLPPALPPVDLDADDPLLAILAGASGPVTVRALEGLVDDSPGFARLRASGAEVIVPLVSQGELIGVLNLGPRKSERDYSRDDRRLLDELATHAAPAIRVAQLVREQQAEARERERVQHELRVATLIQQQFLPATLPSPEGWRVGAHYRPAREVGGDFYDFLPLPGGRLGIVVGDVTDKGVPAALVMSTTHSLLRAEAPRLGDPGAVLARVNELLVGEMPRNMFVTCLYAVLDPATGHLRLANAGHNLPYVSTASGCVELRARGLPLGLLPGMTYEETEAVIAPGEEMLLHSDGLAEAHGPSGEMFGFPRLQALVGAHRGDDLVAAALDALERFVGPAWEQEDDITLVTLARDPHAEQQERASEGNMADTVDGGAREVASFSVPSEPGNERIVRRRVRDAVAPLDLPADRLDRLLTAVAEATMNAIEHGNGGNAALPVDVALLVDRADAHAPRPFVRVRITDRGGGPEDHDAPAAPDLEAKLAGLQSPRGWGLFLIEHMVDGVSTSIDGARHTVELRLATGPSTGASDEHV